MFLMASMLGMLHLWDKVFKIALFVRDLLS